MSGESMNVNVFDVIVLVTIGLSILVGFFRGFLREFLSLGAWVGAGILTLYLLPHASEHVKKYIHKEQAAEWVAAFGTYILCLICITILTSIIIRYVKTGAEVGLLDNFMGLLFGALRGLFIVCFAYLVMTQAVISKDSPPPWLKNSVTKSYLQQGADVLTKVAPEYLKDVENMVKKHEPKDTDGKVDPAIDPTTKPAVEKELDKLMDTKPLQQGSR